MIFADERNLLLHELFGRRNARLELPGGIERGNPPTIEFERLPPRRLPIGDRLVDLRINRDRLPPLALQVQDAAELREAAARSIENPRRRQRCGYLQRHAGQLLGVGVTALLDEDVGQPRDEARRDGAVLALILQLRQQRAANIDFGFGEPSLPRLRPGQAEGGEIDGEHQARLGGRIFGAAQHRLDRCAPAQFAELERGLGLAELSARFEDHGAADFDFGFPVLAVDIVGRPHYRMAAGPGFLKHRLATTKIGLRLGDIAHLDQDAGDRAVGAEQVAPGPLLGRISRISR